MMNKFPTVKAIVGMTFIEVLIALFILVTGVLGAVAMQASAKKGSFDAMQRSLASALAQDIIERMRNNDPTILASYTTNSPYGTGKISSPPNCNSVGAPCIAADMVTRDLFEWEQALMGANATDGTNNLGGLIGAQACITHAANAVTVVVTWQARTGTKDGGSVDGCGSGNSGSKRRQVKVEAFIL